MVLFKLAIGNIKKYWKHYTIVVILTTLVCGGLLSYLSIYEGQYNYNKEQRIKEYGSWYGSTAANCIDEEVFRGLVKEIDDGSRNAGFVKKEGLYKDQYIFGSISSKMYDLAAINIVEGSKPGNNEVVISNQLKDIHIGDKINQNNKEYKVSGIYESKNEFIPQIYYYNDQLFDHYNNTDAIVYTDALIITMMDSGIGSIAVLPISTDKEIFYTQTAVINFDIGEGQYNSNAQFSKMYFVNDVYIFVIEALLIGGFILVALTNTSIKRRNQEFALYRGIGMTGMQLFTSVAIENVLIIAVSVILGLVGSMIFTKVYLDMILPGYHYFPAIEGLIIYSLLLIVTISIISNIPVQSSAFQPLSGYFGEGKFKYFQIHYRKLKEQTKLRLAKRELSVNNKMTICYLVFSFIVMFYCITFVYKGHVDIKEVNYNNGWHQMTNVSDPSVSYISPNLGDIDDIEKKLDNGTNTIIRKTYYRIEEYVPSTMMHVGAKDIKIEPGMYLTDIGEYTDEFTIASGDVPKKDNEILMYSGRGVVVDTGIDIEEDFNVYKKKHPTIKYQGAEISNYNYWDSEVDDGNGIVMKKRLFFELTHQIGDTITINNHTYTIVGTFYSKELPYTSDVSLLFTSNALNEVLKAYPASYKDYAIKASTKNEGDNVKALNDCYNVIDTKYPNIYYQAEGVGYYNYLADRGGTIDFDQYCIDLKYVAVPFALGILICFILNTNDMLNNLKDYAAYSLIGMSKKDLVLKQWSKAVVMTGYNIIFMLFIIGLLTVSFNISYYPILQLILIIIGYFIAFSIIYVTPSFIFFTRNLLEMVKGVD